MIKKALLILTLPTVIFIYLESCNKPCEHMETRNITGISMDYDSDSTVTRTRLRLEVDYESYFVQNFQFNLTNKGYAKTYNYAPCFNKLLNPINSVSIVSKNDFSSSYLANTELNDLFIVYNMNSMNLSNFKYDVYSENDALGNTFMTTFLIGNSTIPSLDSIHDLQVTVFCENGDVFMDSLIGVNLKSKL